ATPPPTRGGTPPPQGKGAAPNPPAARRRCSPSAPAPPENSAAGERSASARSKSATAIPPFWCTRRAHNHGCERRSTLLRYTTMVVEDVARDFVAISHRMVWCSVATVGPTGRPRSRVLHPYWEMTGGHVRGWAVTRPTPLKLAHLAYCPYVSCSYWNPSHDTAVADYAASWPTPPRA